MSGRRLKDWDAMRAEFDERKFDQAERIAGGKIAEALEGRTDAERARILRWAFDRFVPPYRHRPEDADR